QCPGQNTPNKVCPQTVDQRRVDSLVREQIAGLVDGLIQSPQNAGRPRARMGSTCPFGASEDKSRACGSPQTIEVHPRRSHKPRCSRRASSATLPETSAEAE